MKRTLLTTALVGITLTTMTFAGAALAGRGFGMGSGMGPGMGPGGDWAGHGRFQDGGGQRLQMLTKVLDLTEEQQAQIKAIVEEEQATAKDRREQHWTERQELRERMHELMQAPEVDEAAIRSLAAEMGEKKADHMLERARVANKIQAVLTPEQKTLYNKVGPYLMNGPGSGRGGGFGPGFGGDCPRFPADGTAAEPATE